MMRNLLLFLILFLPVVFLLCLINGGLLAHGQDSQISKIPSEQPCTKYYQNDFEAIGESALSFTALQACHNWIDMEAQESPWGGWKPCLCGVHHGLKQSASTTVDSLLHPLQSLSSLYYFFRHLPSSLKNIHDELSQKFTQHEELSFEQKKAVNCQTIVNVAIFGYAIPKATTLAIKKVIGTKARVVSLSTRIGHEQLVTLLNQNLKGKFKIEIGGADRPVCSSCIQTDRFRSVMDGWVKLDSQRLGRPILEKDILRQAKRGLFGKTTVEELKALYPAAKEGVLLNAKALPFRGNSIDMIVSRYFPWFGPAQGMIKPVLSEYKRVLSKNGKIILLANKVSDFATHIDIARSLGFRVSAVESRMGNGIILTH